MKNNFFIIIHVLDCCFVVTHEGEEPRREAARHVLGTTPAPCAAAAASYPDPAAYGRLFTADGRLLYVRKADMRSLQVHTFFGRAAGNPPY